jgi:hypothetical protein
MTPFEAQLQNPGPMPIQAGLERRVRNVTSFSTLNVKMD